MQILIWYLIHDLLIPFFYLLHLHLIMNFHLIENLNFYNSIMVIIIISLFKWIYYFIAFYCLISECVNKGNLYFIILICSLIEKWRMDFWNYCLVCQLFLNLFSYFLALFVDILILFKVALIFLFNLIRSI
jgi:hypothetical protein